MDRIEYFDSYDNLRLYRHSFIPESDIKAIVVITHGIAEHCERYQKFARKLVKNNFFVELSDLRGHGRSGGARCYIKSFEEYVKDLNTIISEVKKEFPHRKLFLFGHSMGAQIVGYYVIENEHNINGLILSSAAYELDSEINPVLKILAPVLGKLFPRLKTIKLDSNKISRSEESIKDYESDPFVFRKGIPVRTGAEINRITEYLQTRIHKIKQPILILQGSSDKIVNPEGAQKIFQRITSEDKKLKIYEGFYHELLHDPESDRVESDIIHWLEEHC